MRMTQPTNNLPAARPRKVLTQIAPVSWEHPADSAALQSLRAIPGCGHELGHVMSGHALYVAILILILNFSFSSLPFLAGIALLPIRIALLEWFRKSELSSDRARLLATQDPNAAMRMYLKMAGGGDMK